MSSISTWVQFLRNFFCVLKSIAPLKNVPSYLAVLNNKIHTSDYGLISSQTTVVEYIIAPFQFLAIVFNFVNGVKGLQHGFYSYHKNNKYLYLLDRLSLENKHKSGYFTVVRNRLNHDISSSRHEIIGGFFQLVIATGFFFLMCNSLHIVGPNHPKPVIDALIGQEISLLYFLGRMVQSYYKCLSNYTEYHDVAALMDNLNSNYKGISDSNLLSFLFGYGFGTERLFEALDLIKPDYSVLSEYIHHDENLVEIDYQMTNLLIKELQATESLIKYLTQASDATAKKFRESCMADLKFKSVNNLANSSLELLYFVLNLTAGYGYMMGILAFYFPYKTVQIAPLWLQIIWLGLSPTQADWWGNLVGDAAWTLEPMIVIFVDFLNQTDSSASASVGGDEDRRVCSSKKVSEANASSGKKAAAPAAAIKVSRRKVVASSAGDEDQSAPTDAVDGGETKTPKKRSSTPSKKRAETPSRRRASAAASADNNESEKENDTVSAAVTKTATRKSRNKNKSE